MRSVWGTKLFSWMSREPRVGQGSSQGLKKTQSPANRLTPTPANQITDVTPGLMPGSIYGGDVQSSSTNNDRHIALIIVRYICSGKSVFSWGLVGANGSLGQFGHLSPLSQPSICAFPRGGGGVQADPANLPGCKQAEPTDIAVLVRDRTHIKQFSMYHTRTLVSIQWEAHAEPQPPSKSLCPTTE